MLNTVEFGAELKKLGYNLYSGVPCSFLKSLINYSINECDYVIAANEGDAVAIAAGGYLGGRKSVALMQNSGLTNAVSPLTSLNFCFKLPILGFVSHRGEPGVYDEPQHELMGQITDQLLETMRIPYQVLSADMNEAKKQLLQADSFIKNNETFFFIVKKDTFEEVKLVKSPSVDSIRKNVKKKNTTDELPTRLESLELINSLKDSKTVQFATTGTTGRELYEIEDAANNLYMVGSMGCVSSLGLGFALSRPDIKTVVIDGDGSVLMRMGSLATNAFYAPVNMLHVVLDNNTYDSTGGQATVAANVDFIEAASACGYAQSIYIHNLDELKKEITNWQKSGGLTFLYLKIAKGSKKDLGRPKVTPVQVKERLMQFIQP